MNQGIKAAARRQPIGIFDSGIGGLTVANAIFRHLPNERVVYFGDTAHLPYGDKSADAIRYYCLRIGKFLLDQGCKMIVVACNSASSAGYRVLLDFFKDQALFVNVVDPLVQEVIEQGHRKIGIIATKATTQANVYPDQFLRRNASLKVQALATPLLAPMIEEGFVHSRVSKVVLEEYLSYPPFEHIDALLLACTHYPLIRSDIEAYFGQRVKVYDSTDVVARTVQQQLEYAGLLNDRRTDEHQFFVSDYTESFEQTTRIFCSEKVSLTQCLIW